MRIPTTREIKMKAFSHRIFAIALTLGMCASAFAGNKNSVEVSINTVGPKPYATGHLGYVRNTPDQVQYIGCQVSTTLGSCYAVNSAGFAASCSTTDPATLELIRSLKGDSGLYFRWDANGNCMSILVRNDSMVAPK
jgi:hypothetical protein